MMTHRRRMKLPDLPITDVIDPLLEAVRRHGVAVLQAPPGAGKTTVVPLALLEAGVVEGRIIMLEPRRLAARAAAERMADTLGEKTAETVGYRIRGEARVGKATRIEVVTEGILTRMIQSDPELTGIGAVIFDEFHERSLNADLGLALVQEIRAALREDLKLLVMSATLDAGPVADMLGAEIVTSEGRAFPVETSWLDQPTRPNTRLELSAAGLIQRALAETEGGVLVFLPGEGEIRRVMQALVGKTAREVRVMPLYGAMPFKDQRAAIRPLEMGRKVVLATSIAETSLTIQDIRVVVDCGLSRRARFDPGTGMSALVTEKVTRAEAEQRRGRAGRVAEGWCYRMWTKGAEGALAAYPPPEIEAGDLTGLVLELALWGATERDLAFVTPPSDGGMTAARDLLRNLGALDRQGRITEHGRAMAKLPVHARLAHMLIRAGRGAAQLAALLSDRDPMRNGSDLLARRALFGPDGPSSLKAEARRLEKLAGRDTGLDWAEAAALAYPDRIGLRRPGDQARYILSGGRGAVMDDGDSLASARMIVATDLDGAGREARIRRAAAITETQVRALFAEDIEEIAVCAWSKRDRAVHARIQERLGALVLSDRHWKDADPAAFAQAALDGIRDIGLPWSKAATLFSARVNRGRAAGLALPDMSDEHLIQTLGDWLRPHLAAPPRNAAEIRALDTLPALRAMLDWDQMQMLDREVPAKVTVPTGREVAIDYGAEVPEIAVKLQEMFGVTRHPTVAGEPLKITLLSPAGRPLQVTTDLPGFWESSYLDVRKDMRGRYPKHPWPEDPASAAPTARAKPRRS